MKFKFLTVLGFVLIASMAQAEPRPSGFKAVMLGAWIAGGALDAGSTCHGLAAGGREVVLTQSCRANTAIIAAEMAAGAYGLNKLYVKHPKLAVTLGIAVGTFRAGIAAHNMGVRR